MADDETRCALSRTQRRAVALECLERLSAGAPAGDVLSPAATVFFPRWGIARGLGAINRLTDDLMRLGPSVDLHLEYANTVVGDDLIVVESLSSGRLADGASWNAGDGDYGRWAAAIELRDGRVHRLFAYFDPDPGGPGPPAMLTRSEARRERPAAHDGAPPHVPRAMTDSDRRALVLNYFRRLDRGAPVWDLFSEHAEVRFPRWGSVRGRAGVKRLLSGLGTVVRHLRHHPSYVNIAVDGDLVAAEGLSSGVTVDGRRWELDGGYRGRWCEVFEVRDFLIHRCDVYVDPDFAGVHTGRHPWLETKGALTT